METKPLYLLLRSETHDLLKDHCKRNRTSMTSFVDNLVLNELRFIKNEEERLDAAQRSAGSIK